MDASQSPHGTRSRAPPGQVAALRQKLSASISTPNPMVPQMAYGVNQANGTLRSSPRGGAPDDRKRKRAQVRSILHQQPVATRLMIGSCPEPTAEQAVEACCASVSRAMGYVPARLTHVPSEARWEEGGRSLHGCAGA